MRRVLTVAVLAIGVISSPSWVACSFPPDIRVVFEGWSSDGKTFALRKTVIDTEDQSVAEDVLYVVDVSSSRITVRKKEKYSSEALKRLSLTKAGPVESSDMGVKTFIVGRGQYVYVDYHTVIEGVEEGTESYTIHRRIWTLDNGMLRMIFKEDESFSRVSTQREAALEAYLSPDSEKLLVLFDVSSHFERKGFVVLDLAKSRVVEREIRVLD